MASLISTLISLACSLFCCLFWVVAIGGVVYFVFLRGGGDDDEGGDEASEEPKAIDEPAPDIPEGQPKTPQAASSNFGDEDEDDAKTVLAKAPAAVQEALEQAKPNKPAPRVSGATIIAFDDDDDLL